MHQGYMETHCLKQEAKLQGFIYDRYQMSANLTFLEKYAKCSLSKLHRDLVFHSWEKYAPPPPSLKTSS